MPFIGKSSFLTLFKNVIFISTVTTKGFSNCCSAQTSYNDDVWWLGQTKISEKSSMSKNNHHNCSIVAWSSWRKFVVRQKNEQIESDQFKIKVKLEFDTYVLPWFRRKEVCLHISLKNCALSFLKNRQYTMIAFISMIYLRKQALLSLGFHTYPYWCQM